MEQAKFYCEMVCMDIDLETCTYGCTPPRFRLFAFGNLLKPGQISSDGLPSNLNICMHPKVRQSMDPVGYEIGRLNGDVPSSSDLSRLCQASKVPSVSVLP